ncbi:MAG TPA: hypothetical protein VGV40_03060, partial [Solirubrobacteraceae bacterium]|nr:hypothetical protein [Solirubrobacteraceae bacterium]
MDPSAIAHRLAGIRRRAAGSDAERRAALAAADELRALGYRPRIETVWVRPYDGLVHALHCLAGVVASLVMIDSAVVGAALAGAALVLTLGELTGAARLTRAITPRRATQNVVAEDPRHPGSELTGGGGFAAGGPAASGDPPVRLLLTA